VSSKAERIYLGIYLHRLAFECLQLGMTSEKSHKGRGSRTVDSFRTSDRVFKYKILFLKELVRNGMERKNRKK
jgi:hypothetical protein